MHISESFTGNRKKAFRKNSLAFLDLELDNDRLVDLRNIYFQQYGYPDKFQERWFRIRGPINWSELFLSVTKMHYANVAVEVHQVLR